jgi:hypothetical protein
MPVRCLLGVDQAVLDRPCFAIQDESLAKVLLHEDPVRTTFEVEKPNFNQRIPLHFAMSRVTMTVPLARCRCGPIASRRQ